MKRAVAALVMASLASAVSAEEKPITSVIVWHDSDRAPVNADYNFAPGTKVQVFDLALQRQLDQQINDALKDRGLEFGQSMEENKQRTKDALRQYMATDEFKEMGTRFRTLGQGLNAAVQFEVERVPTIIINQQYVTIGVNSMEEAARAYHREVNQ